MIVKKNLYVAGNDIFTNKGNKSLEDENEIRDLFSVRQDELKKIQKKWMKDRKGNLIGYDGIRPSITRENKYRGQLESCKLTDMGYDLEKVIAEVVKKNEISS